MAILEKLKYLLRWSMLAFGLHGLWEVALMVAVFARWKTITSSGNGDPLRART